MRRLVAFLVCFVPLSLLAQANGKLQLHFIDVGQGDGALVSLALRYFYRIDLREDWQRPYGEATLAYDLTPTGSVAFTVAHRRGRKPPDFKDIDTTLIGIGIKK